MAGQDELIYRIVYEVDDTSLKEAANKVQTVQNQIKENTPVEILPNVGQVVQSAQQINQANQQGIQTLVQLNETINEYKGELAELQALEKLGIELTDEQKARQQELQQKHVES